MKGIVLAGGLGTRLYPLTLPVCKQLLPIYDKPMIYYPLSTLMLAGMRDILIISTPQAVSCLGLLLGNGCELGLSISYIVQKEPKGLAEAFIIGKEFIGDGSVALVLGDNVFFGHDFRPLVQKAAQQKSGATIFGYYVNDPENYGVVEFDDNWKAISLEEKPGTPRSHYAVVGLYFYDHQVVQIASDLKPSARGELEITDVNKIYLARGELNVELMGRGFAWLDTGTHNSLVDTTNFVKAIEERQGLKIACLEEIAYKMGFISKEQALKLADKFGRSSYGDYIRRTVEEKFSFEL